MRHGGRRSGGEAGEGNRGREGGGDWLRHRCALTPSRSVSPVRTALLFWAASVSGTCVRGDRVAARRCMEHVVYLGVHVEASAMFLIVLAIS